MRAPNLRTPIKMESIYLSAVKILVLNCNYLLTTSKYLLLVIYYIVFLRISSKCLVPVANIIGESRIAQLIINHYAVKNNT